MARSKRTKACDISQKVRDIVVKRDGGLCIWCNKPYAQICHYISRGARGLGIPENLVCGCVECHDIADHGTREARAKKRKQMRSYLMMQYPDWDETELRYRK